MAKNRFMSINMDLLPMKAHYFLFAFGYSTMAVNIPMIVRERGFSSSILGVLLTSLSLVSTISRPLFGWLADKYKIHKSIMITMIGITTISIACVNFIPTFSSHVSIRNTSNSSEIIFCPDNPIWDKCLDKRLQKFRDPYVRCLLKCDLYDSYIPVYPMDSFEHLMLLDINTIQKGSSCMTIKEFRNGSNFFYGLPKFYDLNCEANCDDQFLKGTLADRGTLPDEEIVKKDEFWTLFFILLIGSSAKSVVVSMADTICFEALGDDSHLFGRQRMWESIANGISFFFIGSITDYISGDSVFKDYSFLLMMCSGALLLDMICVSKLRYVQPKKSKDILKDVGRVLKSSKILTYLVWVIFAGLFTSIIWNFVFWHLEEITDSIGQESCEQNHIKTLEGVDVAFETFLGDLPFFFFSGHILRKLGHVNCMHLAFTAFSLRFFYYSVLYNPWLVLPIECLSGLSYGIMSATMCSYANHVALPGTEATIQSLVGTLFEGIGFSMGSFLAGKLFSIYNGHEAFRIFGFVAAIAVIIHVLINQCYLKKQSIKN